MYKKCLIYLWKVLCKIVIMHHFYFVSNKSYLYLLKVGFSKFPVSLQRWSTQDGGQHCKFSGLPIQHLRPPTKLIRQHKPGNHETPCQCRCDMKRMEQRQWAHKVKSKFMELETNFKELETKFMELETKFKELDTRHKELDNQII